MLPELMQQQIDLFAPTPPAQNLTFVQRMWTVAFSDEVRAEVLAIIAARRGEWLDWRDFRPVIEKYKISSWFGHVLFRLVQENLILEQQRYYGSQHPWEGNYLGFGCRYAAIGTEGPRVVVGVCNGR